MMSSADRRLSESDASVWHLHYATHNAEAGRASHLARQPIPSAHFLAHRPAAYSTVTALARLRGLSTSVPRASAA
ncbi:hypothetical protein [Lysobacter gummosus]|uniref:hypothetical protein n=1 Tax=Lysobacter gummosus TaxID=262324 RepID=UPI00363A9A7D